MKITDLATFLVSSKPTEELGILQSSIVSRCNNVAYDRASSGIISVLLQFYPYSR